MLANEWKITTPGAPSSIKSVQLYTTFKHDNQATTPADAIFPIPINVRFKPKKNQRYSSRFRFSCEYGNTFDIILEGSGTYEEHEHAPLNPIPK